MSQITFNEEDRIEHINGFSHCRCRNKVFLGNFTCKSYERSSKVQIKKLKLPEDQQCRYNSSSGYCELSEINELELIKKVNVDELKTLTITTQLGLNLLKKLGIQNESTN